MRPLLPPPAAPRTRPVLLRFVARGMRSVAFGVLIALAIAGAGHSPLWPALVESVAIAISCWAFIDLGRVPLARWAHRRDPAGSPEALSAWPGWPLMLLVIAVGSGLGFSVGGAVAGWLLGGNVTGGYFHGGWRQMLPLLAVSLVPGTVITYWFYSRETIAAQEAAVLEAQRQAAETRLKLLESQLEPHMLFNTLANLRVLIGIDPERAQAMLDRLIAFLRATLVGSRASHHPLSAEFARVQDYLALMQVRMGERLQMRLDLPQELAPYPVPPLLLQPLVENSIQHGLEPAVGGGRIDVEARRVGSFLVLTVRDTGVGLRESAGAGTRFGLAQVRERLATWYGAAASVDLAAARDGEGGTVATLSIPIHPTAE
ncbi:MAG: histidine kinase [Pseudomonadota bacterium]|nr:histidine kinase [Pseudomonadota bacterium]